MSKKTCKLTQKIEIHHLIDYDEFSNFINDFLPHDDEACVSLPDETRNIYLFFLSGKEEDDKYWCSYCQMAEPIVNGFLDELKTDFIFAYVDVGDKDYWKNPACPFRTDPSTRLMVIPTLLKFKGLQRLEGSQCNKRELLRMFFEDEVA